LEDARGYYDDPEESFYRPLTQALVLGEWITHPRNISLEDLESPYATTSAKQLDIATVEHTPLHIKPVLLRHREYLKSNVLFLNRETGAPLSAANDPLSDYVYDCANMYNDDTDQQKEFQESVRTFEHFDNNNPSSDYSKKGTPVLQMYGFRHFCPWVSWDDVNGRVFVPQRIGDIEPKTLHPRYVWQLAEVLHRRLAAMGSKTEAAIQKDLTELFPGWALGLVSADDLADEDHIPGPVDLRTGKAQPGFLGRAGSTPAIFGLPLGSALAPLDGESKDAYLQRVNEDTIRSDLDNDVLDVSDNAWLHMLQHIPDEALESFLGLVYATHKEGRKANDQDNAALAALSAKLAAKSQQPHAAEIIRTATRVIERALGRGVGEVLAARGDKAWYTNDRLAELNKAGPLQVRSSPIVPLLLNPKKSNVFSPHYPMKIL
jgi:hypothetical protein